MRYPKEQLHEAQEVKAVLLHAFKSVDLGHCRHLSMAACMDSDFLDKEREDIERIISVVHESTGVDKQIVERFYNAGPEVSPHCTSLDDAMIGPMSVRKGYQKEVTDEEMCEILGYTPSIKKQSFLSALVFGERKN